MTPLERIVDDGVKAFRQAQWYANAEYERKARAVVASMAESQRRSVGQRIRYIAARVAAIRNGGTK